MASEQDLIKIFNRYNTNQEKFSTIEELINLIEAGKIDVDAIKISLLGEIALSLRELGVLTELLVENNNLLKQIAS